jgi:hypothetical protein
MEKAHLFVVSSLREYGNGEQYFGTDGIFRSMSDAEAYIREDIAETLADFKDTFDEEIPESAIDDVSDDYADFRIEYGDKYFAWKIEHFALKTLSWVNEQGGANV